MQSRFVTTTQLSALNSSAIARGYQRHLKAGRLDSIADTTHVLTPIAAIAGSLVTRCQVRIADGGTAMTIALDVANEDLMALEDFIPANRPL